MNVFYIVLSCVLACLTILTLILKLIVFKNNENFKNAINKTLKIIAVCYCSFMIVSLLLPDAFKLCLSESDLSSMTKNYGYIIIRWFSMVNFVILPLAMFYKSPTMRNIALLFCLPVSIASIFFYPQFINDFCSSAGRGINSISVVSQDIKNFLINPTFRSILLGGGIDAPNFYAYLSSNKWKKIFLFRKQKRHYIFFNMPPTYHFVVNSNLCSTISFWLFKHDFQSIWLDSYWLAHYSYIRNNHSLFYF